MSDTAKIPFGSPFAKGGRGIPLWCGLVLLLLLAGLPAPVAADPVLRLDQAEFILSDSPEPPPDSAPWQPQTLPDNWLVSRPDTSGYAWYRLRFDLPLQPDRVHAVYLPWFRTVGAVLVNGTYVGQTGNFEKPDGPRPQLFSVPPGLLHAGENALNLRLWVDKGARGAVSAVRFGDNTVLRSELECETFVRVTGAEVSSFFTTALGIYILLLWLRRRHETMYGYFGLVALCKGLFIAAWLAENPPIPYPYWWIVVDALQNAAAVLLVLYCLRFANWRWPRAERALWIACSAGRGR